MTHVAVFTANLGLDLDFGSNFLDKPRIPLSVLNPETQHSLG